MLSVLEEYCLAESARGLLLLSMPTGSGKTYNVLNFIHKHYAEFAAQKRKILFVTNLKKNLPVKDLQQRFLADDDLDSFNRHVLFLDSNASSVVDHLLNVEHEIPDEFKTPSFSQLRESVEILNNGQLPRSLRAVVEKDIRAAHEPAFRKFITEHLRKEFRSKGDRLKAIHTDRKYQWIGRLYPAVFTDERTVLFMSIDKFLVKNSTLIEPSYNISDRLAKKSVVFIDEFDATKENVLNNIIQSGIRHRTNLLDLFLNIHGHLMQSECPASLLLESERRSQKREELGWPLLSGVMTEMREKSDLIFNKYKLWHTCKSHEEFSDGKRNFLFYDYEFHHVLDARNKRIEIVADENNRSNWIKALDIGSDESGQGADIRQLLREISGFLYYFQRGIGYFAENYQQLKHEDESVLDAFPLESAVRTTLNHFRLDDRDVEFLVSNIMENQSSFIARQRKNSLERVGFYESGFRFHDIVDSDDHDTLSKVYMYDFSKTPESFLCDVCFSSFVVGISATAGLHSNIGNYDLEYLKSTLGDRFIELPDEVVSRLKESFQDATTGYRQIDIRTSFISITDSEAAQQKLGELLEDKEAALIIRNEIHLQLPDEDEGSLDSIYLRYVRALLAWKYFLDHPELRASLCLFNKQAKPGDSKFDLSLFKKFAGVMADLHDFDGAIEDVIVPLGGEGYEAKKESLIKALGDGARRFVLSTYGTIGAGQNLQYPIPDGASPVHINDYPARSEMDFDGLYLDKPTNLLVNIYGSSINDEAFIRYLFQLEFLVENGAISSRTFSAKLDQAFHSYVGKRKKKRQPGDRESLYETRAYCQFVNKIIMQAVGRICRSNMKAPAVHLLADSSIQKYLSRFSVPASVIPVREYTELLNKAGRACEPESDCDEAENKASARSNRAMAYIHRLLKNPWTTDSIAEWESLRDQTLQQPTLDEFEGSSPRWRGAYVQLPLPAVQYGYSQANDYTRVEVSFSDKTAESAVSASASRLPELMRVPDLKELFVSNRWATEFCKASYMLSPPIFNNIYKGALGEVCGRHILESRLGIELQTLDVLEYELFDFKTSGGIYVDFKLWHDYVGIPARDAVEKIQQKLGAIPEAKAVFVINILGSTDEKFRPQVSSDEKVYEIPFLCQNGVVNNEAMEFLLKEFSRCRK